MASAAKTLTFCFDLDGTLCSNTWGAYETAEPFPWAVARVNAIADAGHRVVIHTARGTTTGIDWRQVTEAQLASWGVRYDELALGKPQADVYVDDRTHHVDAWRWGLAERFDPDGKPLGDPRIPVLPPPRGTTVVEVGRTIGGDVYAAEDHAAAVLAAAATAGIETTIAVSELAATVGRVVRSASPQPEAGDDTVFTIAIGAPPSPGFVDTIDVAGADVRVGWRPLSQAVRGIAPWLRSGGVAATLRQHRDRQPLPGWPLHAYGGGLRDVLGGSMAAIADGVLRLTDGSVATGSLRAAAADAGIAVVRSKRIEHAGADELLLVNMPFVVLPVVEIDGVPLGDGTRGPCANALIRAWTMSTGVDPAAQIAALATP